MLAPLRPHPHRGDVVAAGVVLLTLFILMVNLRMAGDWSSGVRLVVTGVAAALVVAMVLQPGSGDEVPRPYESVLYVGSFVLFLATLVNLADVFGSNGGSGTFVWVGLVLIAYCAWFVRERNSAVMTLLAAVTGVLVVVAFVNLAFSPHTVTTFEWVLFLCAIALTLASVSQRDARRRHAVSLVDATGLTVVLLGIFVIADQFLGILGGVVGGVFTGQQFHLTGGPAGWELVLLLFGLGLVGYGAIDRERVPQFLGLVVLGLYLFEAFQPGDGGPSLIGWPIVLLAIAAALLVVGLRPRRDLPPEPPVPPAPTTSPPPTAPTAVVEP
jgi:hypothetical protein